MNLQEELKVLKERIAELEEQVGQKQEFPQDGDHYWYIGIDGEVLSSEWERFSSEEHMLEVGNIYQTKDRAEFAVEKLKVEAELRKFSRPFKYGQPNCNIILSANENVGTDCWNGIKTQGTIYFESEEKAQRAVNSIGAERIKKYIFGVED